MSCLWIISMIVMALPLSQYVTSDSLSFCFQFLVLVSNLLTKKKRNRMTKKGGKRQRGGRERTKSIFLKKIRCLRMLTTLMLFIKRMCLSVSSECHWGYTILPPISNNTIGAIMLIIGLLPKFVLYHYINHSCCRKLLFCWNSSCLSYSIHHLLYNFFLNNWNSFVKKFIITPRARIQEYLIKT